MSYVLEALSGSVQASALDLSQNGIATLEFQDQHRRLHHVSTLLVGRLGDLWEWIVLNHQQILRNLRVFASPLLPNNCLLNPGRGPKSNRTSRLFPSSFYRKSHTGSFYRKSHKFARTRGFSDTDYLVNPRFWTWTCLNTFEIRSRGCGRRILLRCHSYCRGFPTLISGLLAN